MKVLSISTDRNIFKKESATRARILEYGALFEELHVVVFAKSGAGFSKKLDGNKVDQGEQISSNVWVYSTNSWSKWFYIKGAVWIGSKILKARNFEKTRDVITVQDPFETGAAGLKLKKLFGLPLHVQIHTDFLNPYFKNHSALNRIRVKVARRVLENADAIRVVSARIKRSLEEQNFILSTKSMIPISVVPIFVDVKNIAETPARLDLKKKYPQFNFIILVASRLTREKNIPLALKVMERLNKIYPRAGLVVVGDGVEKGQLVSLAKKLGIQESVVFEPWQEDIISYYKTANMFLSTSEYEGYGLSMVEAIAAHCPTVATDAGIAPDLLHDGEVSFVCPVGNDECLFKNVKMLIEDTSLRERFVHEAFERLDKITFNNREDYLRMYQESMKSALGTIM